MMRYPSVLQSFVVACAAALLASHAAAVTRTECERDYKPTVGQTGKDVVWVPTPYGIVSGMLGLAKVKPTDIVYDLGAGDGIIAITAGKLGATAVGIEYEPAMAKFAKCLVEAENMGDKVRIIEGDIFKEDFSKATVLTLYLLPDLNHQLRPQILAMKPGTRVVSHAWDMGEWEPDEAFVVEGSEGFLWIVPARVGGRWSLRDDKDWEAEISVTQEFQRIGGTITIKGRTQPLLGAYVNGAIVGFTFVDKDGAVRSMRGQVDGDRIAGQLRFVGNITLLTGRKL